MNNGRLIGMALIFVLSGAVCADDSATTANKTSPEQRQRMKECHQQATTRKLKGATRAKYVQECMHQKSLDKKAGQRSKMKECEAKAAGKKLKDEARRNFMTDCMMPGK